MILKSRIAVAASTATQDGSQAVGVSSTSGRQAWYASVASAAHRKQFGQFFTPPKVAALMADWVTSRGAESILDPAFGTGILTSACMNCFGSRSYTAFEKDTLIVSYIPDELKSRVNLYNVDFLTYKFDRKFDGITMNPPYIRHREIEGYDKERGQISLDAKCIIPRSANLYIYFAVKALTLLGEGGRAALLIPGEWMSANFAASFKEHLVRSGALREVVLFSNCSNVFDDALTTASILLCEK